MDEIEKQIFICKTAQIGHTLYLGQENIFAVMPNILLQIIYLPKQTSLLYSCICYEKPQYSGEEINQFRFACHTDYKLLLADEQKMLTKVTRPT